MSLFSAFKTDPDKEAKGFWFEDTGVVNDDGSTPGFLLTRAGRTNPTYAKAAERVGKKFRRQLENDLITESKAREIALALFLDTILTDWRNVFDENGNPIPFSRDNADKLMTQLPDLYDLLELSAKKASNFRDSENEDDAGN